MTFDVNAIRAKFPALQHTVDGTTLPVFFDNPAGTQVPKDVLDGVADYYTLMNANSGGAFATSQDTDAMVLAVRTWMADFLNAAKADEIVFGPNMTTLSFSLSRALAATLAPGDEVVVTRMDHDANVAPWLRVAQDRGLGVRWVDIRTEDCTLDMDSLEAALTERTKVVATVHASNAVGTINPVQRIGEMAHAAGALYVVDAVQSAPHVALDVQTIDCDFLLCSSYKFFGPHLGILWGRYELLENLPAYKVRPAKDKPPYRWETGTPAFELICGLGGTIHYLTALGREYGEESEVGMPNAQYEDHHRQELKLAMATIRGYEEELFRHLTEVLERVSGIRLYGIADPTRYAERVPTVAFSKEGRTPREVVGHLAQAHIYVWDGNYYAQEIMERLGHGEHGLVRVGLAHYNTHEEIDRLEQALRAL